MIHLLLSIYGILNFSLIIYSFYKIRIVKRSMELIPWGGIFNGSFVWEDMIIFSTLHTGFVAVSLITGSFKLWLVCFLVFWIIRSLGEILYFFFQQFIIEEYNPHNIHDQLGLLRKIFGDLEDQRLFIIMQVFYQSVMIVCIIALIYVLKS